MGESVGLYGGSFNPIHHGHLIVARAVAERLALSRVIFLPSGRPPHKLDQRIVEIAHRVAMVRLAIEGEPLFELSDFDAGRNGPSYTIETVRHFRGEIGAAAKLFWIIGADSLPELVTWRQVRDLVDECQIVAAARPGSESIHWMSLLPTLLPDQVERLKQGVIDTPQIDISATDIRRRIAAGNSVRYLVPESVRAYIESQRLYRV